MKLRKGLMREAIYIGLLIFAAAVFWVLLNYGK